MTEAAVRPMAVKPISMATPDIFLYIILLFLSCRLKCAVSRLSAHFSDTRLPSPRRNLSLALHVY
jgi:hypothetical protein